MKVRPKIVPAGGYVNGIQFMATPRKTKNHELNERIETLEKLLGQVRAELEVFRRPMIGRNEVVPIDRFMASMHIKDPRTGVKALQSLGLPTTKHGGVIIVNGESLFKATQSQGAK